MKREKSKCWRNPADSFLLVFFFNYHTHQVLSFFFPWDQQKCRAVLLMKEDEWRWMKAIQSSVLWEFNKGVKRGSVWSESLTFLRWLHSVCIWQIQNEIRKEKQTFLNMNELLNFGLNTLKKTFWMGYWNNTYPCLRRLLYVVNIERRTSKRQSYRHFFCPSNPRSCHNPNRCTASERSASDRPNQQSAEKVN